MYRILIINQHSNNRGDEAATRAMIYAVKNEIPDAVFHIIYAHPCDPILDNNNFVINCDGVEFRKILRRRNYIKFPVVLLFQKLGSGKHISGISQVLGLLRQADLVVSAPGGPYIGDIYKSNEKQCLFLIWLARFYNKKLMIYGPSMGPFSDSGILKIRNAIRRRILEKVDVITVREEISYQYLRSLGVTNPNIYCTLDSVLQRPMGLGKAKQFYLDADIDIDGRLLVGISPKFFPQMNAEIVGIIARVADYCVEQYGATPIFVPQLFGPHGDTFNTDLPIIYQIIHNMKFKKLAGVIDPCYDSDRTQPMIGMMELLIGMRLHASVFAINMGVPTICIAYEHKARGFMRYVGLDEHVIDIKDFSFGLLKEKMDLLWRKRVQVRQYLAARREEIRKQSFRNTEKLLELVKGSGQEKNGYR